MADDVITCIDQTPPPTHGERLALVAGAKWPVGGIIVASFMDGETALQERVKTQAQMWTNFANLRLFFRQDPQAGIRISFCSRMPISGT